MCCEDVLHVCMQTFMLRILITKAKCYSNIYAKSTQSSCDKYSSFNIKVSNYISNLMSAPTLDLSQ